MPTIDAIQAMTNAEREYVQANKELRSKVVQAGVELGSTLSQRRGDATKRAMEAKSQEISAKAEKDNIKWDSSIGLAGAAVGVARGAATGDGSAVVQALTKAAQVISNAVAQTYVKQKEIEKAERLGREASKDGFLVTGL